MQFRGAECCDSEKIVSESPVVSGQALTGAELFRRQSAGLPMGCAVRSFNQVNPYLDKFRIYDSLESFKVRHGIPTAAVPDVQESQVEEKPAEVENP